MEKAITASCVTPGIPTHGSVRDNSKTAQFCCGIHNVQYAEMKECFIASFGVGYGEILFLYEKERSGARSLSYNDKSAFLFSSEMGSRRQ